MSIAIEAGQSLFQMYKSGVLTSSCASCLDHDVLAVGCGSDIGTDYWKVHSSCGSTCPDWVVRGTTVCLLDHHLIPAWTDLLKAQHRQHSIFLLLFLPLVLRLSQESRSVNLQHFGLDS